jgi:hypothetical protein
MQPGCVVLGLKGSAPANGSSKWDEFTNAFKTVAVLITCHGVQGDIWLLLELFKETEEPIQVIMDWLEPFMRQAVNRKAKHNGGTLLAMKMVDLIGPNSRMCPLTSSVVAKVPWVL